MLLYLLFLTLARKWLGRAAMQDDYDALLLYAGLLLEGKGGEVDVPQGIKVLERAVERQNPDACVKLAEVLLDDAFGAVNHNRAYEILRYASMELGP